MEERWLRTFENGALRRIFGPKWNEVIEMGGACSSYRGERRDVYRVLVGKYERKNHLEDSGIEGRIILRLILR